MVEDMQSSGLVEGLATSHGVLAFDRPGFGLSDRPSHVDWTPDIFPNGILVPACAFLDDGNGPSHLRLGLEIGIGTIFCSGLLQGDSGARTSRRRASRHRAAWRDANSRLRGDTGCIGEFARRQRARSSSSDNNMAALRRIADKGANGGNIRCWVMTHLPMVASLPPKPRDVSVRAERWPMAAL